MRLRILGVAAAVLAVWGLWTAVSQSQLFEIRNVEVDGSTHLSSDEVVALAAIGEGETLLRLDGSAVIARLKSDPWIADADISRRIPSTLKIKVRERVAVAVVDTGVTFWYVGSDDSVIAESVASSATAVPVVRDVPDFVAEPGEVSRSEALRNALKVLAGLSDDLRATVRTISAPAVEETALLTATGVEIMVGEATNMDEKSVLIADILAAEGDRVVFIDVRSIERPISRGLNE